MSCYTLNLQDNSPVSLDNALAQQQFFLEGNYVVPKHTDLIYSRGVLIFFVPRRAHTLNIAKLVQPHSAMFHRLPRTVAGFDRLNDIKVHFNEVLALRNNEHQYALKSVVVCDINTNIANEQAKDGIAGPKLITGSSAIVRKLRDDEGNPVDPVNYHYNPRLAAIKEYRDDKIVQNNPVAAIQEESSDVTEDFFWRASTRGTIFIYEMESGTSANYLLDPIVF